MLHTALLLSIGLFPFVYGDIFDLQSVNCVLFCVWEPQPNFKQCNDYFKECAERCPKSPPVEYLKRKHRRYLDVVCKLNNETALEDSRAHFENVCLVPMDNGEHCDYLLKCIDIIRDESSMSRKHVMEQGLYEVNEILAVFYYVMVTANNAKHSIPTKCAEVFEDGAQ